MSYRWGRLVACLLLAAGLAGTTGAQDLASFEKRVTVKKLANGLTVVVCERPEAPVFSFFTHMNVGSDREVPGITGLAHMFEHMAFKGTDKIGTTDFAKEKPALEKMEQAYQEYDRTRRREVGRDDAEVARLETAFQKAAQDAEQYVAENEFGQIVEQEGGEGLNAFTNSDTTGYFYSLPSNRLELWAYLESERFLHPVFREFYKEREVVHEERRMRSESRPFGRLLEAFTTTAFAAHPYGQPVVGWPSDLSTFSLTDAQQFFDTYYVPSNMVVTLVGDVKAAEAMPLIEKYFGRLKVRPEPAPLRTIEPPQTGERVVTLKDPSQPAYLEGYHKAGERDKDDIVFEALQDLLSNGRTSRLYRALVRDKKLAAVSGGFNGFPGGKYPNLFAFYGISTPGHTPEEMRDAIHAEIERVKNEDVTDEELKMIRVRAKADLVRGLADNGGLALQLGTAQARFGDWREIFRRAERIDHVTKADLRRVAIATFVESNRTEALLTSTRLARGMGTPAEGR